MIGNVENKNIYQWSRRDKFLYGLTLMPLLMGFIGTAYILATFSIKLTLIFFVLYIIGNIFQAGACVGCPYQGKYCPAIFGVYLGNFLSTLLYKNRKFKLKFNKINSTWAGIFIFIAILFPLYWLYKFGWYYPVIFLILFIGHIVLFLPNMCSKCSYHHICPGGQTWIKCRHIFRK